MAAKETQAERNKRIEAELRKRGAKFTPGAQVREQSAKREAKREQVAATAPATAAKGNGQRRAEQAASMFGGLAGKAVESIRERKARMKRLEEAAL